MDVIVHGGAGAEPDDSAARQAVVVDAVAAGTVTSTPLAAVEAAVAVLEADARFNAGTGGAMQADGVVRTDAGLMTSDRRVGSACSMPGVEHAAAVARVVLEETPHVLVSGNHAVSLAEASGIETDVDLSTPTTRERFEAADPPQAFDARLNWVRDRFGGSDTVGAVAASDGVIAAATSTGGRWFALPGRVGDVPQVGSGFYCTPAGGASATGAGEAIAKETLARRAVDHLEVGRSPQVTADLAIEEFGEHTDETAGVIVLDATGEPGSAFNSDGMQTAHTP